MYKMIASALAGAAGLALSAVSQPATADSNDPIRIPVHNWSSQIVGAHVVGHILEQTDNSVELVPFDSHEVYAAMCEGDVHLVHEVWQVAFGDTFQAVLDQGCVADLVTHDAKTREEWWYPDYVEQLCPGLPDWQALNACAEIFATSETAPKGRFLAGPVDWLKGDFGRVESLGLQFEVANAGTVDNLWAELAAAAERNAPIVLFNWTPNFIEAVYDGKFVEFPPHEPACFDDPAWGLNSGKTHDCGNPKDGYLKIGVWKDMPEHWPDATAVLRNISFTNADVAVMAKLVDVDGLDPEAAAERWLADNEDRWQAWLKGAS